MKTNHIFRNPKRWFIVPMLVLLSNKRSSSNHRGGTKNGTNIVLYTKYVIYAVVVVVVAHI